MDKIEFEACLKNTGALKFSPGGAAVIVLETDRKQVAMAAKLLLYGEKIFKVTIEGVPEKEIPLPNED